MQPKRQTSVRQAASEFEALKEALRYRAGETVGITAALKGAGGYGKTTLAAALARDPEIQELYPDRVLWVELGENPQDMTRKIAEQVFLLTGISIFLILLPPPMLLRRH